MLVAICTIIYQKQQKIPNHIYVWEEKNGNIMHSEAKGFVETPVKQEFKLKSIRPAATVL